MNSGERLRLVDEALHHPDTPQWGRIMLLCMRDDHMLLHQHICEHREYDTNVKKITVAILTTIAIAAVTWLLAGRMPYVFGS